MKHYYQEALKCLREQGMEFAQAHPAVAPLLSSQSTDPDVERILEGTAFLCGLIEQRLDENFPEIIHGLLDMLAPALLLPTPSQSLVQFSALPNISGRQEVTAGTRLASVLIENQFCYYCVAHDMTIFPAQCTKITLTRIAAEELHLHVVFAGAPLRGWLPPALPVFLNAPLSAACQWYKLLLRNISRIEVKDGDKTLHLPATALRPLRPHENHEGPDAVFTMLRDYFILPEKHLFLELEGLAPLSASDAGQLEVTFVLRGSLPEAPAVYEKMFALNVSPVVNLLPCDADPIPLTHTKQDYRLFAQGDSARSLTVYDILDVMSIRRGGATRPWYPYAHVRKPDTDAGTYAVRRSVSSVSGRMDYHIGPLYDNPEQVIEEETLVVSMRCYSHTLPRMLLVGDICRPTDSSPASATFTNIVRATVPVPPIADTGTLWQLFSYLTSNMLPLASAKALIEFLALHIPRNETDPSQELLNRRRVEAIRTFVPVEEERLWKGRPMRGQRLELELSAEGFASADELYLFGSLLDEILARYATINTYTRLVMTSAETGETLSWPPRLGNMRLL